MKKTSLEKTRGDAEPLISEKSFQISPQSRKWLLSILISYFIFIAFLADGLWINKNSYFATYTCSFKNFTILHPVPYHSWYSTGGSGQEDRSLPYMALLRFFYLIVPDRILSLRITSVLVTALSLFFLYQFARLLFSPRIGLVFTFLLVTSPIYLEGMRAFGYQALTHLVVAVAAYLVVAAGRGKKFVLKMILLGLCGALVMTLYVGGRLIIIFPILFFGLYLRKYWRRLLAFLASLLVFFILGQIIFGGPLLNFKESLYAPSEQSGIWVTNEGKFSPTLLQTHLQDNLPRAAGYLLNLERKPFADRDSASRLFNIVYTPFLLLGFGVCLYRRKEKDAFVLLLFLLFFAVPMASKEIQPRRILFSIYPIYLLITIGLWSTYNFFARVVSTRVFRRFIGVTFLLFLIACGGYDLFEFLFKVARPAYNLPPEKLKRVAEFITAKQKEVPHIRYYKLIDNLIMGNPYFARHPKADRTVANIFGEERDNMRSSLLTFTTAVGEDMLYLYPIPASPRTRNGIKWAKKNIPTLFTDSVIPGTGIGYAMVESGRVGANILFREGEKLRIETSGNFSVKRDKKGDGAGEESLYSDLIDGRPATSWVAFPQDSAESIWLVFDFGPQNEQVARTLSFRRSREHLEWIFKEAAFFGSNDQKKWEEFPVRKSDKTPEWIRWDIIDPVPRRYYKFEIFLDKGEEKHNPIALSDLIIFDRKNREIFVEDLIDY